MMFLSGLLIGASLGALIMALFQFIPRDEPPDHKGWK